MSFGKTINLGNSIIGVSILAMPYCFVQSGLVLSIFLIVFSGFLTRLSCHLLLKSAFLARQTSFELLVQDVLGPIGRFLVEIGLIGFLLGTCVAYFIMIGDLAPKILAELIDVRYSENLRLMTVIALSIVVALPLSLLKKVDSLTSLSVLSMILYSCLILKLMFETTDKIQENKLTTDNLDKISYWNTSGLLTTFPIFSMAMSCQTSLFEIFDKSVVSCDLETLKRDNNVIKKAIYLCSSVYIIVGLLGYMAFHDQTLYGNILLAFPPSSTTTLTKFGFTISLLLSFPLCLFPCRTSVHSLTIGKMKEIIRMDTFKVSHSRLSPVDGSVEQSIDMQRGSDDTTNNNILDIEKKDIPKDEPEMGNFHHNLTALPVFSRSSKFIETGQQRLSSFMDNHSSPYGYTKLLTDDGPDDDVVENDIHTKHYPTKVHMTDSHFKLLTVVLITLTVILSLLFPHIEFTLGIIGSTAGTIVCFVLPAYTFLKIGKHSTIELYSARFLLTIGLAIFIFCTYSTVHKASLNVNND